MLDFLGCDLVKVRTFWKVHTYEAISIFVCQSGAKSSAAIYRVIQTAKANGLEPHAYLSRVLAELPKVETLEQIEALLPIADQRSLD